MKVITIILSMLIISSPLVIAQAVFDIQLNLMSIDSVNKELNFEVQLINNQTEPIGLGGQNYRLYYDAKHIDFLNGISLLNGAYQPFTLTQNLNNIDALGLGPLTFEANLGFLNFSMGLLNTIEGGVFLKPAETISVTKLSFKIKDDMIKDCFNFVWARDGLTNKYAVSFVEISEWVSSNSTKAATIGNYMDWKSPSCDQSTAQTYYVAPKIFLQGCYDVSTGLMRDNLRKKELIPLKDPYSDLYVKENVNSETNYIENPSLLEVTGENAIVDWVFIELRPKSTPQQSIMAKSVLLKRNGQIIEVDGNTSIRFDLPNEEYYLIIRHRNHLGVMTESPIKLSTNSALPTKIDFSNPNTKTFGENACVRNNEVMLLWGGNTNNDDFIVFNGGGLGLPDGDRVFFDIFQDTSNTRLHYNHITHGYYNSDTNLDGQVIYQGGNNDIDKMIFFNVIKHPKNIKFFTNFFIEEQIKK